jgi:hypothetical protein
MLKYKVVSFGDDVLGFWPGVDATDIIQVVLPKVHGQDGSKTALKDGLHFGEMMMLEFKFGILDPVPRLKGCSGYVFWGEEWAKEWKVRTKT